MQFKIDENLHADAADRLRQHGHDVMTVGQQGLRGGADSDIADVCRMEKRAIVTLDLDFSNVRVYPPQDHHGIIVLRLGDQSRTAVMGVLDRIIPMFETDSPVGRLWVVDEHKVRIRGN